MTTRPPSCTHSTAEQVPPEVFEWLKQKERVTACRRCGLLFTPYMVTEESVGRKA